MAGGLGALARYGLTGLVHRGFGATFPLGTAVVNIAGCLAFGLIWGLTESRLELSPENRLIILTGFVGSFTTFSTFIFEAGMLIRESQWLHALASIFGQNLLGVLALVAGILLARLL